MVVCFPNVRACLPLGKLMSQLGSAFYPSHESALMIISLNLLLQASTSSRDEWQGKELGTRAGKAVHMLIHHRFKFFQRTINNRCWLLAEYETTN